MTAPSPPSDLSNLTLASDCALFLDFDGTLAEIHLHPDQVFMPGSTEQALIRLETRLCGAIAIISGRDIRDLCARVPSHLWRVGGHGLEVLAPGQAPPEEGPALPAALYGALKKAADARSGVRLEVKGSIAALHYRQAPEAQDYCVNAVKTAIGELSDYTLERGKMVVEARPCGVNKGRAVVRLMRLPTFKERRPVMIGDDVTDESAFEAILKVGGAAVKVGGGQSIAPYRAHDVAEVQGWIERESGTRVHS